MSEGTTNRDAARAALRAAGLCVTVDDLRKALEGVDGDLVLGRSHNNFFECGMKLGYVEVCKVGEGSSQEIVSTADPIFAKWADKGEPFKIVAFE